MSQINDECSYVEELKRPVILKLNQRCTVERQGKYGWEPDTVHEPIYIAVAHIESFSWGGFTYLKMTSGERILVTETPEEIMKMICGEVSNGN